MGGGRKKKREKKTGSIPSAARHRELKQIVKQVEKVPQGSLIPWRRDLVESSVLSHHTGMLDVSRHYFYQGLATVPKPFLDCFGCTMKGLQHHPPLTWKAVGTQCQAQLLNCLFQEASSRMLKQENVFIADSANGSDSCAICFVPPPHHMGSLFVLGNAFAIY